MTHFRSVYVQAGLAVAAALGLSIAALPPTIANARALAPLVTVTPSVDLPATADVSVDISGFTAGDAVVVQECAQVATDVYDCDSDHAEPLTLDDQGAGTTTLTVRRVFAAHDASGNPVGDIDCTTVALGCAVAVGDAQGGTGAAISFAADQ